MALQNAIFKSANFSCIATDAKGIIQLFNVGAERMRGYTAAEVIDKLTPADISDPQEVIARTAALSLELGTPIAPGFEALVFKAKRGIEDIYDLTRIRKDGRRFAAAISVTPLRDAQDGIIGYRQTPIIAMTANTFAEDKARCMEAGMTDFLAKPFDPETLFSIVLKGLEQRRKQHPGTATHTNAG